MQKLELTWIGKGEEAAVEPRILLHDPSKDYGDTNTENMLIHGDNLLALKSLEQQFAGKIKCIYIDPPYNTGSAFEHYDDNLEHSIWLNLMKSRLEILKTLLSDDGYIFVQIDDNEQAYLTVLMDEIFGRNNHMNTICVNMNSLSGVKMTHAINGKRYPAQKEYILLYKKGIAFTALNIEKKHKNTWDKEYNLIIPELTKNQFDSFPDMDDESINKLLSTMSLLSLAEYANGNNIDLTEEWKWDNAYRIFGSKSNRPLAKKMKNEVFEQTILCYTNNDGNKRFFRTDFNRDAKDPRIELVQAEANSSVFLSDNWIDISNDGGVAQEGGVIFPNGKKPERLIERIIKAASREGDFRKWIGIELGNHAYTHCIPRINAIIDGKDTAGCTNSASWQGGGGYRFYELAPSLIEKDKYGNLVISSKYNSNMLIAAVVKLNGYNYAPDPDVFWKQGYSQDNSYIYVTTNYMDSKMLDIISSDLGMMETLLVCAPAFDVGLDKRYDNIQVKKIPQSVLNKCEYGVDNYNLNVVDIPIIDEEEWEDD